MADFVDIHDQQALETVAVFTGPWEAHIARGRLEAEGIPAYVIHENHIWAAWVLSNALGGVKLQVAVEDAERARQIYAAHVQGDFEQELDASAAEPVQPVCPACGAGDFDSRISWQTWLLIIFTLGLFWVIFPPRRDLHACRVCGHRWKDRE